MAFSSTILAIPITIEKANRKSQNSCFYLACLKVTCFPFLLMNLSYPDGLPRTFFKASGPRRENEMIGTKTLKAIVIIKSLDPQ